MAHIHEVIDTDIHYKIDGVSRTITNLNETKRTLAQNDHNSERFTFEIPRYIDGHDLTTCNRVEVHYINIETSGKEQNPGVYEVEDIGVKSDDDETAIFTWLIKNNVTKYAGTVSFIVRFACVDEKGVADYDWHTVIFKSIFISDGIFNSEIIVDNHADILEQWRSALFDLNDEGITNITTAKNDALLQIDAAQTNAVAKVVNAESHAISVANDTKERIINEIIQKGNETKEGIPDSYDELSKKVNETPNIFANTIKGTASGEVISIKDISPIEHNVKVNVSSETVEDISAVKIKAYGKNLLDINNPISVTSGSTYNVANRMATVCKGTAVYAPSIYWELGDYADFVGKTLTLSIKLTEDNGSGNLKNLVYFTGSVGTNRAKYHLTSASPALEKTIKLTCTVGENTEAEKLCIRLYLQNLTNAEDTASFTDLQLEVGEKATEPEDYKESAEYIVDEDGTVKGVKSIYPNMTLLPTMDGVVIDAEYNIDTKKYIDNKFAELQALILEG